MVIRNLTETEITEVYREHIEKDFPPAELKPLETILAVVYKGEYLCFGFYEEDVLVAYAFFMKHPQEPAALLDYYAVVSERRNTGIGSQALQMVLAQEMKDTIVLIEAEWPEMAETEQERVVRERRVSFYRKNGMYQKESIGEAFGVKYTMFTSRDCSEDLLQRYYREVYYAILPKNLHKCINI